MKRASPLYGIGTATNVGVSLARALFTNGMQERATRVVLYDEALGHKHRDLGGWSEGAMAAQIRDRLLDLWCVDAPRKARKGKPRRAREGAPRGK